MDLIPSGHGIIELTNSSAHHLRSSLAPRPNNHTFSTFFSREKRISVSRETFLSHAEMDLFITIDSIQLFDTARRDFSSAVLIRGERRCVLISKRKLLGIYLDVTRRVRLT